VRKWGECRRKETEDCLVPASKGVTYNNLGCIAGVHRSQGHRVILTNGIFENHRLIEFSNVPLIAMSNKNILAHV
jgi:hypothetical protein